MGPEVQGLPDVARAAGASVDQLRYWLRLLAIEPVKQGKTRMISTDDSERLSTMARMVAGGVAPKEAAARIGAGVFPAVVSPVAETPINAELSEVKRAMIEMAATFQKETAALRAELTAIRQESRRMQTPAGAFHSWYQGFFQPVPRLLETCRDRYYHQPVMLPAPEEEAAATVEH